MSYLEELRRMEEKSVEPQVAYRQNRQKAEKPPFDPFGSTSPGESQNFVSGTESAFEPGDSDLEEFSDTHEALLPKPTKPIWWRIYRDGEFLCVVMSPKGLDREEALRAAGNRWPTSAIEVKR